MEVRLMEIGIDLKHISADLKEDKADIITEEKTVTAPSLPQCNLCLLVLLTAYTHASQAHSDITRTGFSASPVSSDH